MEEKTNKHKTVVSDDFWHSFNEKWPFFFKSETHYCELLS